MSRLPGIDRLGASVLIPPAPSPCRCLPIRLHPDPLPSPCSPRCLRCLVALLMPLLGRNPRRLLIRCRNDISNRRRLPTVLPPNPVLQCRSIPPSRLGIFRATGSMLRLPCLMRRTGIRACRHGRRSHRVSRRWHEPRLRLLPHALLLQRRRLLRFLHLPQFLPYG